MADAFACQTCGGAETRVTDSRPATDPVPHIRRRRECGACGDRFTTMEIVKDIDFSGLIAVDRLPDATRSAVRGLVAALSHQGSANG